LPENLAASAAPVPTETRLPTKTVAVAQPSAERYESVPLPHSVATPLKLSFAPLEAASAMMAISPIASRMATWNPD
jgi:hypothetical protein